jgi:site-specific recombinase XerD
MLKKEQLDVTICIIDSRCGPRAGNQAELGLSIHTHMLRVSTGFKLANDGRDTQSIQHYLGHKNI